MDAGFYFLLFCFFYFFCSFCQNSNCFLNSHIFLHLFFLSVTQHLFQFVSFHFVHFSHLSDLFVDLFISDLDCFSFCDLLQNQSCLNSLQSLWFHLFLQRSQSGSCELQILIHGQSLRLHSSCEIIDHLIYLGIQHSVRNLHGSVCYCCVYSCVFFCTFCCISFFLFQVFLDVCPLVVEQTAYLLNIGDSRAYHISREGIRRVTRDHSVVEDMVARGDITPEEARNHPRKNLITRALGSEERIRADLYEQALAGGDFLLLCSDGLSNIVTDQEMLYEALHGGAPEDCCQRLLDIAMSRGAPDNVTAVLFEIQ